MPNSTSPFGNSARVVVRTLPAFPGIVEGVYVSVCEVVSTPTSDVWKELWTLSHGWTVYESKLGGGPESLLEPK